MSKRANIITGTFDEEWYRLEFERLVEKSEEDFLKRGWEEIPDGAYPSDPSRLHNIAKFGIQIIKEFATAIEATARNIGELCCDYPSQKFLSEELKTRITTAVDNRQIWLKAALANMCPFYEQDDIAAESNYVDVEVREFIRILHRKVAIEMRETRNAIAASSRKGSTQRLRVSTVPDELMRFRKRAGELWREAQNDRGDVTQDGLLSIAAILDAEGFLDPAKYLEKAFAEHVRKFNSRNANSPQGSIKTWTQLVTLGDKDNLRGMRRILSRCAAKLSAL